MPERRVFEAGQQIGGIGLQILSLGSIDRGGRFLQQEPLDQRTGRRITHRLMDIVMAVQQADIGQRRVGAVQHAQLGGFKGPHIVHHLRARLLPRGASGGKMILDYPLGKPLGEDRAAILHSDAFGKRR